MTLDRYLVRQFFPVFVVALSLFVLLLSLIDLFANLWRYLAYDAPAQEILRVGLFYLPKCVSYALPVSLLFAAAYVLGELYARNELTVVFTSGIPLARFTAPILFLGLFISIASFYFEDRLVIPSFRMKKELGRALLHQNRSGNNSDVVVKSEGGRLVYAVDFYNDDDGSLNGLAIVERNDDGRFEALIRARRAVWMDTEWVLEGAVAYRWIDGVLKVFPYASERSFREDPDTFRRNAVEVDELSASDASLFVDDLKSTGLPFAGALADYYRRYAFAATSLVVLLLSVSIGGRFRKNILLMSLLSSLVSAVVYYVAQMLSMMLAKLGYIDPLVGAWAPVGIFTILGLVLVRHART